MEMGPHKDREKVKVNASQLLNSKALRQVHHLPQVMNRPRVTKTPSERSEKAVDPQNTETIDLGEKVPEMKAGILRK